MADVPPPPKKRPKKARFPNPAQATNKPAGIPKTGYPQRRWDYINGGLIEDQFVPSSAYEDPWERRNLTNPEQPRPRQIDPYLPDPSIGWNGDPSTAYGTQAERNPFLTPDLGAGMNPFSGGGAAAQFRSFEDLGLIPPKPNPAVDAFFASHDITPDMIRDYKPQNIGPMMDSERQLERAPFYLKGDRPAFVLPHPEPDLTVIHPEALEGLVPNRQVFPRGIPSATHEEMINNLPVARQARLTRHLTDYPTHLPRPLGIPMGPAAIEAADMAGLPLTRGGLVGAMAGGVADSALGLYDPIMREALNQAILDTQNQVERFILPQYVLQGLQASREMVGRGVNRVAQPVYNAGTHFLNTTVMPPPPPPRAGGRPVPAKIDLTGDRFYDLLKKGR